MSVVKSTYQEKGDVLMRKVRCYECGKQYNYDEDGFCPGCGAFNQPPRESRVSADGQVVRVDGIDERNHAGSFVHQELHAEKRDRKKYKSDRKRENIQNVSEIRTHAGRKQASAQGMSLGKLLFWIVFGIIALNVLSTFLMVFF